MIAPGHIYELRQRGGIAAFMTTHSMNGAENCGRIGIMDPTRTRSRSTSAATYAFSKQE